MFCYLCCFFFLDTVDSLCILAGPQSDSHDCHSSQNLRVHHALNEETHVLNYTQNIPVLYAIANRQPCITCIVFTSCDAVSECHHDFDVLRSELVHILGRLREGRELRTVEVHLTAAQTHQQRNEKENVFAHNAVDLPFQLS